LAASEDPFPEERRIMTFANLKQHRIRAMAALLLLVSPLLLLTIQSSAEIKWSDDFNDGNFDGWTVVDGDWSASNGSLELLYGWPGRYGRFGGYVMPGAIYHPSETTEGTWSFDLLYVYTEFYYHTVPQVFFMCTDPLIWNGYCIEIKPVDVGESLIPVYRLLRSTPPEAGLGAVYTVLASRDGEEGSYGWKHFDVTRSSNGLITVWLNGSRILETTDTAVNASECRYFLLYSLKGWGFDNVIVDDTITIGQIPLLPAAIAAALVIAVVTIVAIQKQRKGFPFPS